MDLAKDYNLAKPVEVDDYTRNAVGQFMTVMPELMNDLKFNGNIVTCSEVNFDEDIDIPTPDYIIDPCFFLVTIGESFENRCKRYECAEAFKFIPIDDSNGASVILCDNLVYNRQSVNIILDYKTKEEWRDTLELAFITADKYYTDATKFSIKSAIGYSYYEKDLPRFAHCPVFGNQFLASRKKDTFSGSCRKKHTKQAAG